MMCFITKTTAYIFVTPQWLKYRMILYSKRSYYSKFVIYTETFLKKIKRHNGWLKNA